MICRCRTEWGGGQVVCRCRSEWTCGQTARQGRPARGVGLPSQQCHCHYRCGREFRSPHRADSLQQVSIPNLLVFWLQYKRPAYNCRHRTENRF